MSKFKCECCGGTVKAIAVEAYCGNTKCVVRRRITGEGVRSFKRPMLLVA